MTAENRLLKSLHKRQDSALLKYESTNAELPQLLHSHAEELRMWQTRCRNLQRQNKELQAKLKQKDTLLLSISDQNKQLLQLNRDKNLQERAFLQERVKHLEQQCMDKENEVKLLARRIQLESKAFKSNINMEQAKYRDLLTKIEMSDFLMVQENNKKLNPPKSKPLYGKSVLNRSSSKSAGSSSNNNHDKECLTAVEATTVLPPCNNNNSTKRIEENTKQNSPYTNKNNLKILNDPNTNDNFSSDETNLTRTKNCINTSASCSNDETLLNDENNETLRIKNGIMRARQERLPMNNSQNSKIITSAKLLSPLHSMKPHENDSAIIESIKDEKKSNNNDSELSDDDDFHFSFTNHNGTKTVIISPILIRECDDLIGLLSSSII